MNKLATLAVVAFMTAAPALAQSHETTTTDKQGNRVVVEISDAPSTKGDTLSVTTYTGKGSIADSLSVSGGEDAGINISLSKEDAKMIEDFVENFSSDGFSESMAKHVIMPMVVVILVCVLLPIVCVIAVLVASYKKRKAKYRLAEKILESGQPLPESLSDILGDVEKQTDLYSRGIKNICIGVALSLFLFFLTDELGIACIGLFVVANGVSQLLGYRRLDKAKKTGKDSQADRTEDGNPAEQTGQAE